jgi:hypothetical protein
MIVRLRLDVKAEFHEGVDENLQRALRESSKSLGFEDSEFE